MTFFTFPFELPTLGFPANAWKLAIGLISNSAFARRTAAPTFDAKAVRPKVSVFGLGDRPLVGHTRRSVYPPKCDDKTPSCSIGVFVRVDLGTFPAAWTPKHAVFTKFKGVATFVGTDVAYA